MSRRSAVAMLSRLYSIVSLRLESYCSYKICLAGGASKTEGKQKRTTAIPVTNGLFQTSAVVSGILSLEKVCTGTYASEIPSYFKKEISSQQVLLCRITTKLLFVYLNGADFYTNCSLLYLSTYNDMNRLKKKNLKKIKVKILWLQKTTNKSWWTTSKFLKTQPSASTMQAFQNTLWNNNSWQRKHYSQGNLVNLAVKIHSMQFSEVIAELIVSCKSEECPVLPQPFLGHPGIPGVLGATLRCSCEGYQLYSKDLGLKINNWPLSK